MKTPLHPMGYSHFLPKPGCRHCRISGAAEQRLLSLAQQRAERASEMKYLRSK